MRNILVILLVINFSTLQLAKAQESVISEISYSKLEQYIALAKQYYPRKKIFAANEARAKAGVPLATVGYLDPLTVSYIYRPNDHAAVNVLNPYQVNGFQFTASLNLGNFLQKPFQVKQAKAEYLVAQLENQEYDLTLASEVKNRYYAYILQSNDLKVKTQAFQDSKILQDDTRSRFEKGEVTMDVYSNIKSLYSVSISSKMEAEVNFLKAQDALEEIIGTKLADIK
ncbi:Outer membrane efflux protein [bacterium A37T11]|nr:Outer membrane efflux protein [bacterium A37T11]